MNEHYINNPKDCLIEWSIICTECGEEELGGPEKTKEDALREAWTAIGSKDAEYYSSGASSEPDSCCCNHQVQITTTETYV